MPEFERKKWLDLGLAEASVDLIEKEGFLEPSQVQLDAIPAALSGKHLLVSAKTGSGKTASFCLPIIEKIRGKKGTLALILCPTREIALQTFETLEKFAKPQGISSMSLIGGTNIRVEDRALKDYPQIIVGTPGRILDQADRGNLWIEYLKIVVLDEADRMLDMGFSNQLNQILDKTPDDKQVLFFSATFSKEAEKIVNKYATNPHKIIYNTKLEVNPSIKQEILWLNSWNKLRELLRLLREIKGRIIVFTSTKVGATQLWKEIDRGGFKNATYISSDQIQKIRVQMLEEFKSGKFRILVATDIVGRGIHVEDVEHVISFDFPNEPDDYVHRVGRTGRKDASGSATTFITPQDAPALLELEKALKIRIPEKRVHDFEFERPKKGGFNRSRR